MRKYTYNNRFKLFNIMLTASLIVIINSCKKDISTRSMGTANNAVDLTELKMIYHKDTTGAGKAVSMIGNRDVNWDKIYYQNRAASRVFEFDMGADNSIWTSSPNPVNYLNKTDMVFIDFTDGSRLNFYMKVIEDHTDTSSSSLIRYVHYSSIPAHFNGDVMFYGLNREFINGYKYVDGKVKGRLAKKFKYQ